VKVRDVIKLLRDEGWVEVRRKGSHRQFQNERRPGTVTVAGAGGEDIPRGTLNNILKQAGLR
jgi:predicted RNA binding protein YcfA (HicA-like mRNA interferase family)